MRLDAGDGAFQLVLKASQRVGQVAEQDLFGKPPTALVRQDGLPLQPLDALPGVFWQTDRVGLVAAPERCSRMSTAARIAIFVRSFMTLSSGRFRARRACQRRPVAGRRQAREVARMISSY